MKTLTNAEKAEIEAVTAAYAASLKTHPTKGRYEFNAKQSNFSSVNFSADISDFGNPSGIYEADDYEDYSKKAKAEFAIQQIRRLTLSSTIKDNLKEWILKKNNIVKRNRAAKAERQKEFEKRY